MNYIKVWTVNTETDYRKLVYHREGDKILVGQRLEERVEVYCARGRAIVKARKS